MLTTRVKAYSSSCSHTAVYLQPFRRDFYEGTTIWCPRAQVSLNLENQDLDRRNLHLMLTISYAAFPCLYQLLLAQFALEMCLAARNRQKINKNPYFSVQGHPRSLNLVAIESQCTTFY